MEERNEGPGRVDGGRKGVEGVHSVGGQAVHRLYAECQLLAPNSIKYLA